MCLAVYIASERPLPLVPQRAVTRDALESPSWPAEAQRFHTAEIEARFKAVRSHFAGRHVRYAGSYEGCGCGFNFGREHPEEQDDPGHLVAARESIEELVRYICEAHVQEIYSCWFEDEGKAIVHTRTITPEALAACDFYFRERELLTIEHPKRPHR